MKVGLLPGRGSFTGRRITDDLVPAFAAENDPHLAGPDKVSLRGRLALHTTTARTKLMSLFTNEFSGLSLAVQ
jgi:hypothetical protein